VRWRTYAGETRDAKADGTEEPEDEKRIERFRER
jgi:hypothetical protein